jgi:hypothetical protein
MLTAAKGHGTTIHIKHTMVWRGPLNYVNFEASWCVIERIIVKKIFNAGDEATKSIDARGTSPPRLNFESGAYRTSY